MRAAAAPAAPEGIVTAIVAVTGTVDSVNDLIIPGAFADTLATRRPKVAWMHDWKDPIGRVLHIVELKPGDKRLPKKLPDGRAWPVEAGAVLATMQFHLGTVRGREMFEHAREWAKNGEAAFSIGYAVKPGMASKRADGVRLIYGLDLFEVSLVLHGAHNMALALEVKSAEDGNHERKDAPGGLVEFKAAEPAAGNGAMVAVFPPADVAAQLARPDGTPPEHLHVTLAFLGDATDVTDPQAVMDALQAAVGGSGALSGQVGGIGVFPAGDNGTPVWVPVDVPGLIEVRQSVVDALEQAGFPQQSEHGYTPHLTLGYDLDSIEPAPATPVEFTDVVLVLGEQQYPVSLTDAPMEGKAAAAAVAHARGLQAALEGKAALSAVLEAKAGLWSGQGLWDPPPAPKGSRSRAAAPRSSGGGSGSWNSSKHPRAPKGTPGGGKFIASGSGYSSNGKGGGDAAKVRNAQGALIRQGFLNPTAGRNGNAVDGLFGRHTDAAARAWQQKHGYSSTGRLTASQLRKLLGPGKAAKAKPTAKPRQQYSATAPYAQHGRGGISYPTPAAKPKVQGKSAHQLVMEAKAGLPDHHGGDAETLREYWTHGAGAAKIAWGTPGDFDRCVAELSEHMTPENAKGYCNLRHHDAIGIYPATHAKLDGKAHLFEGAPGAVTLQALGEPQKVPAVKKKRLRAPHENQETKAMPTMKGSFEERANALRDAVNDLFSKPANVSDPMESTGGVSIEATFDTHVIVTKWGKEDESYAIPYTIDPNGDGDEVTLGKPVPVDLSVVAIPETDDDEAGEPTELEQGDAVQVRLIDPAVAAMANATALLNASPEGKSLDSITPALLDLLDALAFKGYDVASAVMGDDEESEPTPDDETAEGENTAMLDDGSGDPEDAADGGADEDTEGDTTDPEDAADGGADEDTEDDAPVAPDGRVRLDPAAVKAQMDSLKG